MPEQVLPAMANPREYRLAFHRLSAFVIDLDAEVEWLSDLLCREAELEQVRGHLEASLGGNAFSSLLVLICDPCPVPEMIP